MGQCVGKNVQTLNRNKNSNSPPMTETRTITSPRSPTTREILAARHQTQITQQRTPFTLRMHRALSWLQRAETAGVLTQRFLRRSGC